MNNPFTTLLIDLDDTLYPSGSGLWHAIRERMSEYMHVRLNFPMEKVPVIRQHYLETYGTTLRGLQLEDEVDTDDFLSYVHDLPLQNYIHPDPALRKILLSLPQQKWIFTNADLSHAKRVLSTLNLGDCFDGIIDVRSMNFLCKPDEAAYLRAIQISGVDDPRHSVMFDDSIRNLLPAQELGLFTVLVGANEDHSRIDRTLTSLRELPQVMPELWDQRLDG